MQQLQRGGAFRGFIDDFQGRWDDGETGIHNALMNLVMLWAVEQQVELGTFGDEGPSLYEALVVFGMDFDIVNGIVKGAILCYSSASLCAILHRGLLPG